MIEVVNSYRFPNRWNIMIMMLGCILAFAVQPASAQQAKKAPASIQATTPAQNEEQSLQAMTTQADVIVVGIVDRMSGEWNEDKTAIRSRISITVREAIKGTVPGDRLTVTVPGGEVDGVGEWYSHTARFTANEEVVVFAGKDNTGQYSIAAGQGGKYVIRNDQQTGKKTVANAGTLDEFTSQIKKHLNASGNTKERK